MSAEVETIRLFLKRLQRLYRTGLAQDICSTDKLNVKFRETTAGEMEIEMPELDEDGRDAFMLNYRLLSQDNDRISLAKVSKLLSKAQPTIKSVARFERRREMLNQFLEKKEHFLASVSNRELIEAFLYGRYAHVTPQKEQAVIQLEGEHGDQMVRMVFVVVIEQLLKHLRSFEEPTEVILKEIMEAPRKWD